MSPELTLAVYSVALVAVSICGGYIPSWIRLTHTRTQLLMSFVAGLMLGVGFFHLLPHAAMESGSIDRALEWTVGGFVAMFILLRAFHFHQHEAPVSPEEACQQEHHHHHPDVGRSSINWLGVAVGMSIHTLMDGVALAANVLAESEHSGAPWLLGVGTFLAIFLHKPLDSLSITLLMTAGGWSAAAKHLVNVLFSLMCPLGCALFVLGIDETVENQQALLGAVLGLSAGVFLCIAVADLMPELELHSHHRVRLSCALVLGIALAYAMHALEGEHSHDHDHGHATSQSTAPL